VVETALEDEGFVQPISMATFEVGPVLCINRRFDRGVRLGVTGRTVHFATTVPVEDDENVLVDADVTLNGTAGLVWLGFRWTWRFGLVIDYRLGGGMLKSTADATVNADVKVGGQTLASVSDSFEKAFDIPWMVSALSVGWAF